MVKGIRGYDEKQRRRIRRANHIARDLRKPQFRMRRVEINKQDKYKNYEDYDEDEL